MSGPAVVRTFIGGLSPSEDGEKSECACLMARAMATTSQELWAVRDVGNDGRGHRRDRSSPFRMAPEPGTVRYGRHAARLQRPLRAGPVRGRSRSGDHSEGPLPTSSRWPLASLSAPASRI
jgi:hypothetical protein